MSSLQKFHRRTLVVGGGVVAPFLTVGSGSNTIGYRLGYASGSSAYLIVAPKSTEVTRAWGSSGTTRGTTSTTNGVANTTTLFGFGSTTASGHPAAHYAKSLTTGGYNTWYLPAKDELNTLYSNKSAEPFATANSFIGNVNWSSTEADGGNAWGQHMNSGGQSDYAKSATSIPLRAVRQYYAPAAIGDGSATTGFWLGTAGDGVSKLIVAPKSTEVQRAWGSYGTVRSTTSTTNGVANTTTLFNLGAAAHPAAHYAKSLTTGGYNTWYLPAKNELNTLYSNKSAVPFATANSFVGSTHWSSTEYNGNHALVQNMSAGNQYSNDKGYGGYYVRATRRSTI
jgi:gas vesicle protein